MSILLNALRLRYELAIRGMSALDLAKRAHLSPATVSAVLRGRYISEASAGLMADVLNATPVNEPLQRLLGPFEVWLRGVQPPGPATEPA